MALRNDPVNGLIQYVDTMKPYHSKIAMILVEYLYSDNIDTTIDETFNIDIDQTYETNPLDCPEGFGYGPYGFLIRAGSRRLNPFYNSQSTFYNPIVDSSSSQYDPNWDSVSPNVTNRELVVSLVEYPILDSTVNPFYDPTDSHYNDSLDLSSGNYQSSAFDGNYEEFELAVSLEYPYPSSVTSSEAMNVVNPFYNTSSSYYEPVIDPSSVQYDPNVDPGTFVSERRACSIPVIEVNGEPYNPFYDIQSAEYVSTGDRNSENFEYSTIDQLTLEQQSVSLVFLPFTENIQSNWDNGNCPDDDEHLASSSFSEELSIVMDREGNFNNDLLVSFDPMLLFSYDEDNTRVAVDQSSGDGIKAIAKSNFTLTDQTSAFYFEWDVQVVNSLTSIGLFSFNPDNELPYNRGRVTGQDHIGYFEESHGWLSNGRFIINGTEVYTGSSYTSGDTIGIVVNMSSLTATYYKNGIEETTLDINFNNITTGTSVDRSVTGNIIKFVSEEQDLSLPSGTQSLPLNI